ncbi:MAG TPA: polysaccharide deacetylase family protein [Candidatus Polarisedimenticolia bacterium]|nr:polysaccharide deacetylase family protein [Candidatus Polarisedimenticolia bacterium]
MKAVSILYHDVVSGGNWHSSGFLGPGTTRYKLDRAEFAKHLAAIAQTRDAHPALATDLSKSLEEFPFLLTFDDGGESAYVTVADLLEKYGWKAHFLITAGYVGTRGFLSAEQIRSLRKTGHVIGTHSFSHPEKMSDLNRKASIEEWSRSLKVLSDILGERVSVASVPKGFYSRVVAESAAFAGIHVLFNSEPTTKLGDINGCLVLGRFTVFQGMAPSVSGNFVSEHSPARQKQWLYWNFKKILKSFGGELYLQARGRLLRKG